MLFRPKKYIYLSVCFQGSRKPYAYRTDDKSIKVNDVVMVPVPNNEPKPADDLAWIDELEFFDAIFDDG